MRASKTLIERLKKQEGCRLEAYQDAKGVWTIGWGHTKGVRKGDRITEALAVDYLREDLRDAERVAEKVKNVNTQGRFDAVVDFVYNCGAGNFNSSTLRKYIEAGKKDYEIQQQFLKWVNSGGKFLGGLYTRRIWEANRWTE